MLFVIIVIRKERNMKKCLKAFKRLVRDAPTRTPKWSTRTIPRQRICILHVCYVLPCFFLVLFLDHLANGQEHLVLTTFLILKYIL